MVQRVDPIAWSDMLTAEGQHPSSEFIRQWQVLISNVADLSAAIANITILQNDVATLEGIAYVTVGTSGTLTAERALAAGTGISITDNGANSTIVINSTITQYTDEMAEDAVGGILTDSSSIDFTYNDGANTITAAVKSDYYPVLPLTNGDLVSPGLVFTPDGQCIGVPIY